MVISKGMVVAAAVIAFGIVSVDDATKGFTTTPTFSFTEAQAATTDDVVVREGALRRQATETLRILTEKQESGRAPGASAVSQECRDQSWPYYSGNCLVRGDGTDVAPAARIVRADRVERDPAQKAVLR